MKAVDVFENIASSTWQRIYQGILYNISQGEETITDLNLLEIARAKSPEVHVIKTPKDKEKFQGTDWEWWIGNKSIGWLRYAVQAKKIDVKTTRYSVLKHKVKETPQIEILAEYAKNNHAIPLYCFYNYLEILDLDKYWQCNFPYEVEQFGCTVTPLNNVRKALSERGAKNFTFLHKFTQTKPWRCLVRCPLMLNFYNNQAANSTDLGFENVRVYRELPRELSSARETGYLEQFSPDFYRQDLELYPKRILVANYAIE